MLASDWTGHIPQWRQLITLLVHTARLSCELVWRHGRSRGGLFADHAFWLCRRA